MYGHKASAGRRFVATVSERQRQSLSEFDVDENDNCFVDGDN